MFSLLDFIARKWGLIGLANANAVFGLMLSYVTIVVLKYRTLLVWPSTTDIAVIAFFGISLDAWLISELFRDWQDGSRP